MSNLGDSPQTVFVIHRFIVGGVETLISRLGAYLLSKGMRVAIVVGSIAEDASHLVPPGVDLHIIDTDSLLNRHTAVPAIRSLGITRIDLLFTGDPWSCWMATVLSTSLPERPKHIAGVYQPDEYIYPSNRAFFRSSYGEYLRSRNFDRNVPDCSKTFMSDWIRTLHARSFKRDLDSTSVMILPVQSAMFANCVRNPERHRIVSVGRITKWKTYHQYMPLIVQSLSIKGYPVHWDIYGEGEFKEQMVESIRVLGIESLVTLHGTLEYERYSSAMSKAGVFVGMGTAMVEAAFCRVPCVSATARCGDPLTYGNLYDLPVGIVGEHLDEPPGQSVEKLIERIFQLSAHQYDEEMQRTWEYAQMYDIRNVCSYFDALIDNASPSTMPGWQEAAYRLHRNYLGWRRSRHR